MSNGTMKVQGNYFTGQIRTMRICLDFYLERNSDPALSDKAPTHKVIGKSPMGHKFQAGVAWERSIQRGRSIGQTMFSIVLDDPEFGDKPLNFSAFPGGGEGELLITLERQRAQASPKEENQADDIPFAA